MTLLIAIVVIPVALIGAAVFFCYIGALFQYIDE